MRLAYADPPYPGQAARHYSHDERCAEVNHRVLIGTLCEFDGWALSTSSSALREVLALCPADVRIAAWCKSFGAFKKGVRPAYMWEPVIYRGGRNPPEHRHAPPVRGGVQSTPKDFLVEPITMQRGLAGAKPEAFCRWVLELLGFEPEVDEVTDLFPGTDVMGRVVAATRGEPVQGGLFEVAR